MLGVEFIVIFIGYAFMKKFIFFFPLLWLFGTLAPLKAQLVQPERLELELKEGDSYYSVISAEEEGLILYRLNKEESKYNKEVYDILCYDTNLEERWTTKIEVENAHFTGYEYSQGKVFFLFQEKKHKSDNYQIFSLDIESSFVSSYSIDNSIPIELTEFTTVDNIMLLGGYVNYRPTVVYFDLNTEKYRVVPGLYMNNSELLEIKTNEENSTFTILQTEKTRNKQYTISTKTYDRDCNPIFDYRLKPDPDRNLLFGRTTSFGDDALHIAGTYSHGNTRFSRGIFIANIYTDGSQKINYYNYGDLENFFSYMKVKREKRMKDRIERKKIKGKKIKLNYRLLVHDVLEENGSNILLGEAFYPKYSSRPTYSSYFGYNRFTPSGRNFSGNQSNLEGYQYTHAVLIGFDNKGALLWDNSFEINDVISPTLQKYIQVLPYQDYTVLFYMYEDVVHTKIIKKNEVLEGKQEDEIVTLYEGDKINDTEEDEGGLKEWYGPYFYAFGVQKIKNVQNEEVKMNRKVFFINKISYQPPSEGFGREARANPEK